MPDFYNLQRELGRFCASKKLDTGLGAEVHAVTFQPLRTRRNQDRLVVRELLIAGQEWLFLAVCDGHGGSATAKHTASHLPSRIRSTLEHLISADLQGRLDRENIVEKADLVSAELKRCILDFDSELGQVIETICPDPRKLSEKQACAIIAEFPDALRQACAGTTLAAAVVNLRHQFMWAINIGDSTVALSLEDESGKRVAHELCSRHSFLNPREYRRVVRDHPGEGCVVDCGRLLRLLPVSRAIGDYAFKLNSAYTDKLFRFLGSRPGVRDSIVSRIQSPPYVTADPSLHFVDLQAVWNQNPTLMLFSDGVDNLVRNARYLNPWRSERIIPSRAIAVLLQDKIDGDVEDLLGYEVDPKWSGKLGNRAVDVLGNLVGGKNTKMLAMAMDQDLLVSRTSPRLYIDDTSIVICSFTDVASCHDQVY